MSMPQVGAGAVAIVPTFRGFRRAVENETDGAAKRADRGFRAAFSKTGDASGTVVGVGFRKAYEKSSAGFADKGVRDLEQAVAKSARTLSAARLKEQDAAGRVRLAETQLAEARGKYANDSSQVVRAEERLATALRQVETAQENTADSTQALRSAQSRLADNAEQQGDRFVRAWRRSNDRVGDVFKGSFLGTTAANLVSGAASRIGANIGEGIRDGVSFALGTLDIASDFNESLNAVQVSYGDVADGIFKLGETSARTFGLSKRDTNQYAVQFSAFSKTIAGEGGDVVGTFESILGRATDFASVMNLEVADALVLFQSGLAGETEPLRRYGIDLSAASVEAYAYANGIGAAGTQLTEAQKQQARYAYLLAQTSQVQGDFANTSDELANKQRIQAAAWDDLQAKMGASFLPVAQEVVTIVTDELMPALDDLMEDNGPLLADAFEDAIPALREVADELLPKLPTLIQSFAEGIPVILDMITTFGPPLIDLIDDLTVGAAQIQDFFDGVGEDLEIGAEQWGDFFGGIGDFLDDFFTKLGEGAEQIGAFLGGVGDVIEGVGSFLGLTDPAAGVADIPVGRSADRSASGSGSSRRGREGGGTFGPINIDARGNNDPVEIGLVAGAKVASEFQRLGD